MHNATATAPRMHTAGDVGYRVHRTRGTADDASESGTRTLSRPRTMSPEDSTRVRDQRALTSASGTSWLVVATLITLVEAVVLVPFVAEPPAGLALGGLITIAAITVGMYAVRLIVAEGRRRNVTLALMLGALSVVALLATGTLAVVAWQGVGA